jgi:hypothetical protein
MMKTVLMMVPLVEIARQEQARLRSQGHTVVRILDLDDPEALSKARACAGHFIFFIFFIPELLLDNLDILRRSSWK